jgi:hypothetical protein
VWCSTQGGGSKGEALSLIRAKELAQAALAEAADARLQEQEAVAAAAREAAAAVNHPAVGDDGGEVPDPMIGGRSRRWMAWLMCVHSWVWCRGGAEGRLWPHALATRKLNWCRGGIGLRRGERNDGSYL